MDRKFMSQFCLILGIAALSGCSSPKEDAQPNTSEKSSASERVACSPSAKSATYSLIFEGKWSAATHPNDFPSSPHLTRLAGLTHDDSFVLWQNGGMATPGVQAVAEKGQTTIISAEIQNAIDAGVGGELFVTERVDSPATITTSISIDSAHPLVSAVSMIGPSPDWFVGVDRVNLCEGGEWKDEVAIELFPWDAGTKSATSFTTTRTILDPHKPIAPFLVYPFTNSEGLVASMGTIRFKKL